MVRYLRYLLVITVILCGCAKRHESNTFKETSETKTYTYAEALNLSEDSRGFYNFFLLPNISPTQALAFEQKFAIEQGTGYNIYTGAGPQTVIDIYEADVPLEALEDYVEILVAYLQRKTTSTAFSNFNAAIKHYHDLCKTIPATYPKKIEAQEALASLLFFTFTHTPRDADYVIHYIRRTLDRVKFQHYDTSLR